MEVENLHSVDSGGRYWCLSRIRNVVIDVPEFLAILPNATEEVVGHMTVNGNDEVGTNLQLRYESDGTIMSLTTDSMERLHPTLMLGSSKIHPLHRMIGQVMV